MKGGCTHNSQLTGEIHYKSLRTNDQEVGGFYLYNSSHDQGLDGL